MVKISDASYENEIHKVEDSKNIIFLARDALFWRGTAGKFRENGQKQRNLLLCKLGSYQF